MIVQDQFDPKLRKTISKGQVAVIPVGSIEQHGAHLPVSTDSDIVTEVARRVAKKKGFLLMPTVQYGVSFEHAPFFNLSIQNSTLKRLLKDIITSLIQNKVKTVFVINGHHGNQQALKNLQVRGSRVFVLSYWHFMQDTFDHAGIIETSLMLAISKNVKMSSAKKGYIEPIMSKAQKATLAKKASKSFISVTKNGIWGDPRGATRQRGVKLLDEIVQNVSKKCQTCLTGQTPKLHQ